MCVILHSGEDYSKKAMWKNFENDKLSTWVNNAVYKIKGTLTMEYEYRTVAIILSQPQEIHHNG